MAAINKTSVVQTLIGDVPESSDTALIGVYLNKAENAILNRMYPFRSWTDRAVIPPQYEYLQCELASRYILRRGAEGETAHNENGINRSFGSTNDEDLLKEVMQVVGV